MGKGSSIHAAGTTRGMFRRELGVLLVLLTATLSMLGVITPTASAATLSTNQVQWNLAGLAYMSYGEIDGAEGPATRASVKSFQVDRCMDADGEAGPRTGDQLVAVMKQVQAKVGVTQDGLNGPTTKQAIINWQKAHGLTADGMAGPATMSAMGIARKRACGGPIVGDVKTDSSGVACAAGTNDLGVHTVYSRGTAIKARLCAIPGFKSTSDESTYGSRYYVAGANGNVIVNSRVSNAFLGIFKAGQNSGLTLSAASSYRTYQHQKDLCAADDKCPHGDYSDVAKPGHSAHEAAVAVDYAGTRVWGGSSCTYRATDTASAAWNFLYRNAGRFGIQQYSRESWHWDAWTDLTNRC